jgi:thiosulfate dehydrogenase [quinone] large subunit
MLGNQKPQKLFWFALRVLMGWTFFYAGIVKVADPDWSAAGYLANASTFPRFYAWLASPGILPVTDFLNQWGLTLIGAMLLIGLCTRLSAWLGALMMALYYFPVLDFPHVGSHSYLVDEHIIYATVLLMLTTVRTGRWWGLDAWVSKRLPRACQWLG